MLRYRLDPGDFAEVRFAISPLNEVALSLRALRDPARFPLHLEWLRGLDRVLPRLDEPLLRALCDERFWTPDFLTPRPETPLGAFDRELAALVTVPPATVARDLAAVHPLALPEPLLGDPERVRDRVLAALDEYWRLAVEPFWPRWRALLEADVLHRSRQIAERGVAGMFATLAPTVRLRGSVVEVRLRTVMHDVELRSVGAGLTLVPTLFTRNASAPIAGDAPPMIMYPARGLGALYERVPAPTGAALAGLIGATRAGILAELEQPASPTELALRRGITPSAASQHLRALRDGGLLESRREHRSVRFRRSELGEALVARAALGG
ncbi:MAG: DUF5937 family protein [Microbacteriaceae bacterium]|jgi:DNA-binding transcriptional ArsR family regulator